MNNCQTATTIIAPAKLNIGLRIVGRREDGYHLLQSIFWPLTLCDRLSLTPAAEFSLSARWDDSVPEEFRTPLPPTEGNLVFKAHRSLPPECQQPHAVELIKNIPMEGGLGGGSSDAGSYLKSLVALGVIDTDQAQAVAIKVGADVPFFLHSKPSWVSGIGESVLPIKMNSRVLSQVFFLVVLLPVGTSTVEVFKRFREQGSFTEMQSAPQSFSSPEVLFDYFKQSRNDLEPAACAINPLILEVLNALQQTNARHVAMSGSGSTCFAVFDNEAARQESVKALHHFCRQFQCRTLKAETYVA